MTLAAFGVQSGSQERPKESKGVPFGHLVAPFLMKKGVCGERSRLELFFLPFLTLSWTAQLSIRSRRRSPNTVLAFER